VRQRRGGGEDGVAEGRAKRGQSMLLCHSSNAHLAENTKSITIIRLMTVKKTKTNTHTHTHTNDALPDACSCDPCLHFPTLFLSHLSSEPCQKHAGRRRHRFSGEHRHAACLTHTPRHVPQLPLLLPAAILRVCKGCVALCVCG